MSVWREKGCFMTLDELLDLKARTPRPLTYCLCGSTNRAAHAFRDECLRLTLAGHKVLTIGVNARDADLDISEEQKVQLDLLHLSKIDDADVVRILNVGGYLGESTRRELEYAQRLGKRIEFLEEDNAMNERAVTSLPVAVPPMLEQAIGYTGDARLVAFFFDAGDEAYYADGHMTTCGEWDAYGLFIGHPMVTPHLRRYHLGSSEEPPTHYLLLDRQTRTLSVAPVALVQRLLHEQWGSVEATEPMQIVTELEWDQLVQDLMARITQPTPAQLAEHWHEHRRLVEQLAAWLAEKWEDA